ncbi:asparagine synthase (glutamine-hydrolyzing) [Pontibacter sp. HSC-14F20]|uniref:asparagine synthase (glutamine-hydrolyzing) n=1 Tax=Pontibacter sp. HSC-14F20 TaxID=2864136 RepID=UPI001C734E83|nr:asparagine synthase (glutamine-hydrolyzing) [Pontibacter sp. HSC-14F20]MBX0332366.1 asparagine synthase (glutamine-hydrolyzing) [Pontibacter sp. HSC-14F20]
MCGIAGIINFNQETPKESALRHMMQQMKHRGPNDDGVFIEDEVGFGFVRLSIIDLSPDGHQPMVSADGRYVLEFNGEIFNYVELREELQRLGVEFKTKTDTEVLLNAYIQWGEDCMNKFNGMWAFAIYDRLTKTIFASRDRYGIKPFYYIHKADYFAFCSEIPPLLSLLEEKPTPNHQSIFDYLAFNRTDQSEATFFEEVKKLQHGMKLTVCGKNVKISRWYDLREKVSKSEKFKSPEEYKELFTSAVGLRLRSDVPVGVCLSGGLDSSSITSVLLNNFHKKDLNTFSAVYQNGQTGDEKQFIHEYKPLLNHMHYTYPNAQTLENDLIQFIKTHAEPIPSTSPYAQYKVMELAKDNVVVTLDGQGADEQLAGYHYFFGFYFKDLLRSGRIGKLVSEIYHYLNNHRSLYGLKSFVYFLLPENMRTKMRVDEKGYMQDAFVEKYSQSNGIAGNLYGSNSLKDALLDHFENKLEHLLKWEDLNSMHFSLEARVPFLDYRLVEKTLASSDNWAIRHGITKFILREAMKGVLPEKIRMRQDKIGFGTPQDEWFREPAWRNIIEGILKSDSFRRRNLINAEVAIRKYREHLSGKTNIAKEIWKWVHLELWFRTFIDQDHHKETTQPEAVLNEHSTALPA